MKNLTFIVTVRFPNYLEDTVVRNYINMAVRKYDKLVVQYANQSGYFDGSNLHVSFNITEVPVPDKTDLREVISQVNKINDHFERIE